MIEKKRIYIIVKTYPTISDKYSELVCTAGVLEDGSWIRLYPIPFRKLDFEQKYKKYSWIQVEVERNKQDFRPETYRPVNLDNMKVEKLKLSKSSNVSEEDWKQRRDIIFKNKKIYTNLREIIDKAKSTDFISLAIFKPTELIDFVIQSVEREWDKNKLQHLKELSKQMSLFQTPEEIDKEFKVVQKVPYKFSYKFKDDCGKISTMMIEDWEIGMLYFNCLQQAEGDEDIAIQKVKEKYWNSFIKRDLYFFLGTTKKFHNRAKNPFIIIGVFYPPYPKNLPMNGQMKLWE